ncbi:MAG TPA: hypothetical protein VFQ82_12070 [Stellaceae bacterium]|jgi:hypothetical protein|nr:hypothetical protein [Stellaceae bacterium]
MSCFISSFDGGYINLDRVTRTVEFKNKHGVWCRSYYDSRDDKLGETLANIDLELATATVVSAAPGATAILLWLYCPDPHRRPTEDHICIEVVPIIAWRIPPRDAAIPVFIETLTDDRRYLIAMPEGSICDPENRIYRDLGEAKADALASAQAAWDRQHSQAKKGAETPCQLPILAANQTDS